MGSLVEYWQSSAFLALFMAILDVLPLLTLGFVRELRVCPDKSSAVSRQSSTSPSLSAVMSAGPPSADEGSVAEDEGVTGESGGELKVDESSVE